MLDKGKQLLTKLYLDGKLTLIVLDKGKQLLTKLYLDGKLTMKKGYDGPLKVIGA